MNDKYLPSDYGQWIQSIKNRVRNAQFRAMVAVNVELMLLYWDIGRAILDCQKREGWGANPTFHVRMKKPRISWDFA